MIKQIRVAVIGKGRWGKKIIDTLKTFPNCDIAYVKTRDYRELLPQKDINAVVIATPASTHAKVALPFIKKGLSVFIEKPMTTSVRDAQLIARVARTRKSLVFVGHIHLYNPAYLKTKELIKKIGPILYIFSEGAGNGSYRDDTSVLWDWGPHSVYMILDLLEEYPVSVEGWGISHARSRSMFYDTTYTKLNFKKGLTAFIFNSWLFPEKRKRIVIVGEKSTIVFDDMEEKKVTLHKNVGSFAKRNFISQKRPTITHPLYDATLSLSLEIKAFLNMVRTRKKTKTDIKNGIAVVKILEAAELSMKENHLVMLKK